MIRQSIAPAALALWLTAIFNLSPPSESQPRPRDDNQELRQAELATETARAAYYRERLNELQRPAAATTLLDSIKANPASMLGVLGAIITAVVGLFSFYKNQRLAVETQYDTQFYEALKRFGDKESARLRASAVWLLSDMALRPSRLNQRRPDSNSKSRYFTVLNQLVAGSRLEEHRVVLSAISDAIADLGRSEPAVVMEVLYRANIMLQGDLKRALQAFSFHYRGPQAEVAPAAQDAKQMISPAIWAPSGQITGFDTVLLYDWFLIVTKNLMEYDESAAALVDSMTPEERARDRQRALEQLKVSADRLKHNVDACCSTLLRLCTIVSSTDDSSVVAKRVNVRTSRARRERSKIVDRSLRLELDGIFLWGGNLVGLTMPLTAGNELSLRGAFLYEANLSNARLAGASMRAARLIRANLFQAVLSGSDLAWTRLERATLDGANLSRADVKRARLWGAAIDEESVFTDTNWWTADFYDVFSDGHTVPSEASPFERQVDETLLAKLFARSAPPHGTAVHESVMRWAKDSDVSGRDDVQAWLRGGAVTMATERGWRLPS